MDLGTVEITSSHSNVPIVQGIVTSIVVECVIVTKNRQCDYTVL